jgi:hypothetical protein
VPAFNLDLVARIGRSNTKIILDNPHLSLLASIGKKPYIQTNNSKEERYRRVQGGGRKGQKEAEGGRREGGGRRG